MGNLVYCGDKEEDEFLVVNAKEKHYNQLTDKKTHRRIVRLAIFVLSRELPKELVASIVKTMNMLVDFYTINEAFLYNWTYTRHVTGTICLYAPKNFQCYGWCNIYKIVYDGKEEVLVPECVYDIYVRRTGTRRRILEKSSYF